MRISSDRIAALYRLNQILLDAALCLNTSSKADLDAAAVTVAEIGNKLDRGEGCTPDVIAEVTADLFSCLAALSGKADVAASVERINDSLHCLRVLEQRQLDGVRAELIAICELFLAEEFHATADAIADYHARRLDVLPELFELLRR